MRMVLVICRRGAVVRVKQQGPEGPEIHPVREECRLPGTAGPKPKPEGDVLPKHADLMEEPAGEYDGGCFVLICHEAGDLSEVVAKHEGKAGRKVLSSGAN